MSIHRRLKILFLPICSDNNEIEAQLISNYIVHILKFKFITFNNIKIIESKNEISTINEDLNNFEIINLKKNYDMDCCISNNAINTDTKTIQLESIILDIDPKKDLHRISTCNSFENSSFQNFLSNSANISFINDHISKLISKISLLAEIEIDNSTKEFFDFHFCKDSIYPVFLNEKNVSARLDFLNQLLSSDNGNPLYLYEQALCLRTLKSYNDAICIVNDALKATNFNTFKSLLYYKLGNLYKIINNEKMAIDSWANALNYKEDYTEPILALARIYEDEENLMESAKYYMRFQQIQPEDARSYLNLARIHCKKESWQKAIEEYKKHLVYYPHDAWSHSNMANCYLCLDKTSLAKKHLEEAIHLDSSGEAGMFSKYVLESLNMKVEVPWWKFWAKI